MKCTTIIGGMPGMIAFASSVTGWSLLYGDGKVGERIAASLGR